MTPPPIYRISPRHTSADFEGHWTIDDKIEVFVDRVQGWQLGVATEMIRRQIPERALALLHIVTSFFEMLSKYYSGSLERRGSKSHFQQGIRLAFPAVAPEEQRFLDSLYDHVRCGLYHIGSPSPKVMIATDTPGSLGYHQEADLIVVNPDMLVNDLCICFDSYAQTLRDPNRTQLRRNFERRFDFDNHLDFGDQTATPVAM